MGMQSKDWLIFRILTNKFHANSRDLFLKNLPVAEAEKVLDQNFSSTDASLLLIQPQYLIEKIHYSWFLNTFKEIPKALQPALLASLPKTLSEGISKTLNIPLKKMEISLPIKRYLINMLYTRFEKKEILPNEFLPDNPLNLLLGFSKQKIVTIIDYLGLYDLSDELRHIVEKNLLKKVYLCLSLKKQQFLKNILNQKEKLLAPRLEITNENLDREKLETTLHKRGLIRLAQALSGKHKDFVWHIVHLLDSGRGQMIATHYKAEEIPVVSQALTHQVVNVINYLNKTSQT